MHRAVWYRIVEGVTIACSVGAVILAVVILLGGL